MHLFWFCLGQLKSFGDRFLVVESVVKYVAKDVNKTDFVFYKIFVLCYPTIVFKQKRI